jgi:predicted ATP-binding protein involved in virulence
MRLSYLSLRGYYGFRSFELSFPERGPTLLIGKNGAGKSTVLDAVAMFLSHFANIALNPPRRRVRGLSVRLSIDPEEVHRGLTSARTLALFAVGERRFVARATYGTGNGFDLDERLKNAPLDDLVCDDLVPRLEKQRYAGLPVLAYYRPNRGIGAEPGGRKAKPPAHPQLSAYLHAFGHQVGPFQEMLRWFRAMEDQENEERLRRSSKYRNPRLQAVRTAIERFMSALAPDVFRNLRVVRDVGEEPDGAGSPWHVSESAKFFIDKGSMSLPLDSLSDGERGVLLLVADLAMRLVITNPGATNPLEGSGIVLIDELELHLHPGWQRRILQGLCEVFPNVQIIATTHSPQVLSTLHPESVVVLEDFQLAATPPTYGRDTNSLLRDPMGTAARPEAFARELVRIHKLIGREEYGEARKALDALAAELGELDPEIVELRTLAHAVGE